MAVVPYECPAFHVVDLVLGDLIYLDPTSGHQLGQRLALGAAGTKLVSDLATGLPAWGSAYPKGWMERLPATWLTATTMQIGAGSARASDDTDDLVLAANTTLDLAVTGVGGIDIKTSAATAATHGTATFEPSASIVAELGTRAGQGTITTSGTAVTGGTGFLTDLAIGDLIGNATKGWSRVTAIASDSACTIAAAPPGGAISAAAYTIIENATVWPGATTTDKRQIRTLSAAGTSVVLDAILTSSTGAAALKLGVQTIVGMWMHPWLVKGGSGTSVMLSSQRTTPYSPTGYTTTRRRIPCAVLLDTTVSPGAIRVFACKESGGRRTIFWPDIFLSAPSNRIASSLTSATFATNNGTFGAPPTALSIEVSGGISGGTTTAANNSYISMRITGTSVSVGFPGILSEVRTPATAGTPTGTSSSATWFPWNSAGAFDVNVGVALTAGSGTLDVICWEEEAN